MLHQSNGKIFLSGERGHTETDWFRSYNTFNFGNYKSVAKEPFQSLYVLNDDTLAGGKGFKLFAEEDSLIFLLPTVGAVTYNDSLGNESFIEAGNAQIFKTPKGTTIEISNPFENELINFLQLWFKYENMMKGECPVQHLFDLANKNRLLQISFGNKPADPKFYMGKFDGRAEAVHKLASPENGFFVFVLEGAFEVQYRLLETRDSLALWNFEEAEIEALSNNAIILAIEIPRVGLV